MQVIEWSGDWARIRCVNGWSAWVDGRYLDHPHPTAEGEPPRGPDQPAPQAIRTSFRLWITAATVTALLFLVGIFAVSGFGFDLATLVTNPPILLICGLYLVIPVVITVLAASMRTGKQGARIALAVIGGVWTLYTILPLVIVPTNPTVYELSTEVMALAEIGVITAAIVLMFRPAANDYFRRQHQPTRPHHV